MGFLSNTGGDTYNLCHCKIFYFFCLSWRPSLTSIHTIDWSNFEIADMNFWRGEAYTAFFEFLEKTGNFYYEDRTVLSAGWSARLGALWQQAEGRVEMAYGRYPVVDDALELDELITMSRRVVRPRTR